MQLAFEKASKAMGYGGLCRGICTQDLPVLQKRGPATPHCPQAKQEGSGSRNVAPRGGKRGDAKAGKGLWGHWSSENACGEQSADPRGGHGSVFTARSCNIYWNTLEIL